MKSLFEFSKENLNPIQHIFELSDDLLKRAAATAKERGSAIEKRRAKEFENWLNNTQRKKIQELDGKSKQYKMFVDLDNKYLKPAIEAYNNDDNKSAQKSFESFYNGLIDIIKTIETEHIKILIPDATWYQYNSSRDYLQNNEATFKPRHRKNDKMILDTYGTYVNFSFKNVDSDILKNFGYQKTKISIPFLLNIFKEGGISSNLDIKYSSYYTIPKDWKKEVETIVNIFSELGLWDKWTSIDDLIGAKSLSDEISIGDFFMNLQTNEWTKYDLDKGLPQIINKIEKFFNSIDSSSKLEWINKDKFQEKGWFSFTAELKLTYKGKDLNLKVNWKDNYSHTSGYIAVNDEKVYELKHSVTVWDAGCYTDEHAIEISKEIDNLFK